MLYNLFLVPSLLVLFMANPVENSKPTFVKIKIKEVSYNAEYANTAYKKSKGYMFTPFSEKEAMIFYYKNGSKPGFYNINVNFPLRVYWVGSNNKIVDSSIFKANSFRVHRPKQEISYVIEIPLKEDYSNDLGELEGVTVEIDL